MRKIVFAAAFAAAFALSPATAGPLGATAGLGTGGSDLVLDVKKGGGGRGHGHFKMRGGKWHGYRGNRGLHRGWYIGRGNPHRYGRWRHHRRHHYWR